MQDTLTLRNARILTQGGEVFGHLAIAGGRIAAIGPDLPQAGQVIDAGGRILLPGAIDSHCHIAQRPVHGEAPCPDDFTTATRAAAAGGITTVIPHSMCPRGADQAAILQDYLAEAAGAALVDYGVHLQMPEADPGFLAKTLPGLVAQGFPTLKLFTTYEGYTLSDAEVLAIMATAADLGALCLIHAEDDALIRHLTARALSAGRTGLTEQPLVRPAVGEAETIHRIANYAAATGARMHVFHVSGAAALEEVRRAKARGVRITAETCPHYLTFTAADLARPDFAGAKYLCSPALRCPKDQAALWAGLADGSLECWSSDHSPSHRMAQIGRARAEEAMPFTAFGGGMPGLQTLLPILFSEGVMGGRISLQRFVELTAGAPARLFGLPQKGRIAVGADADLTLWDPGARWVVRHAEMESRVDFTPWDGMALRGRPVLTLSRGRVVMRDGVVDGAAAGHGQLLRRERGAL